MTCSAAVRNSMAINFCDYCQKEHFDTNWRVVYRNNKLLTFCSKYFKPTATEFVPDSVKEERKKYVKSTLQPWRKGEASAEFIEAYPERSKKMFTTKERMMAKEVWKDTPNHNNWRKTK